MNKINEYISYHHLVLHNFIQWGVLAMLAAIFFYAVLHLKTTRNIIRDILKVKQPDGSYKWSETRVMMAFAFYSVLTAFNMDEVKNGLNMAAWIALLVFAATGHIPKAYSEKINPTKPTDNTSPPAIPPTP